MPTSRSLPAFVFFAVALTGLAHCAIGANRQTQQQAPPSPADQPAFPTLDGPATSCLFDFERGEVPDCIRQAADGKLFVSQEVLKLLQFDSFGLAPVLSAKEGWMYVNRKGRVVIRGVPVMDNGADWFHNGLVRIVRNGKYGFANRRGQLVISPVYDGALNFEKGLATVCQGCKSKCSAPNDCEYHIFAGGHWFQIDTKGTVVARLHSNN
jgi:hypothetical protein